MWAQESGGKTADKGSKGSGFDLLLFQIVLKQDVEPPAAPDAVSSVRVTYCQSFVEIYSIMITCCVPHVAP